MRADFASSTRQRGIENGRRSDAAKYPEKSANGAEFLSRALITRAIRRSSARQILQGGAGTLGIVIGDAQDAAVITAGAESVLRSSARNFRVDWKVGARIVKRNDTSRRASSDPPSEEEDEAARTIVIMDATIAPTPWFEAMTDGIVHLGQPDWELVNAGLKVILRQAPVVALPPEMLAVIPLRAYGSAIRPGSGCSRAIARLRRLAEHGLLRDRTKRTIDAEIDSREPSVDDLHGLGAAGEWAKSLDQDLSDYKSGKIAWRDVDRGVLLSGPPGAGKTTFAKALGRTCKIPVHIHSLAAWQARGYLNDLLKAMREAFDKAKANAPCILFIDEIDSFGDRETLRGENARYGCEVINGFLECLDGATGREGVVVVGATNYPDSIDAGIRRPGRLDRHIIIPLPNTAARIGILRHHLGHDLIGVNLTPVAARLAGASGAAIEQLVREGRRRARAMRRPMELADVEACLPPMVQLSPAAFRRSCIHEAGHMLIGLLLASETGSTPVYAISSAQFLGSESGATRFEIDFGFDQARSSYIATVTVLLAGIAAERLLLSEAGLGSGGDMASDLARATQLLADVEMSYCLGGNLLFIAPAGSPKLAAHLHQQPEMKHCVETLLRSCMHRSVSLITANRTALVGIANVLGRKNKISSDEARQFLEQRLNISGDGNRE